GKLAITEVNRGRVRLLDAKFDSELPLQPARDAQHLEVMLEVEPPSEYLEERKEARVVSAPDGSAHTLPDPEALSLRVRLGDEAPARFEISGRYRGEDGVFRGHYRLADIGPLLNTLSGGAPLPSLVTDTQGQVELDSFHLRGKLALKSRTRVSDLQHVLGDTAALPQHLDMALSTQGNFDTEQFTLAALKLDLIDTNTINRFALVMGAPLSVPFATPQSVLDTPRELARLVVGPLPLAWLQGLAEGQVLNGELLGPYALLIDEQKRVRLEALAPTSINGVRAAAVTETVMIENLSLLASPSASWSTDFLRYALNDVHILIGEARLAEFSVKAASKQSEDALRTWRYRTEAALHYDALALVPSAAERIQDYPLPSGTSAAFKGIVAMRAEALSVDKAQLEVSGPESPKLVRLDGLRPFHFTLSDGLKFSNPEGDLATLATRGVDLAWLNPVLKDMTLSGYLASADFKVVAPSAGALSLSAVGPLSIEGFGLRRDGRQLLRGLAFKVAPDLQYSTSDSRASFKNLSIRSGAGSLVSGDLDVAIHTEVDQAPHIATKGRLSLDVVRLAGQPVVATALQEPLPELALEAALEFDLELQAETIKVNRSHAELKVGDRARLTLDTTPGLALKTQLAAGEDLAQHFIGAASLDIKDLSSETLNRFVPLGPLSFAEIN
ncbi:unnamed protein product, partial [Phaeothamnion confervicola]